MVNKDRLVVSAWGLLTWCCLGSVMKKGAILLCAGHGKALQRLVGGLIAVPEMAMLPLNFIQGLAL